MAMIRKRSWQGVGGYAVDMKLGWEDYEFWLKIAAARGWGVLVPEVLARYRVHLGSMIRTQTNQRESLIWNYLEQKYPHVHRPKHAPEELTRDGDDVRIHCDRVELLSGGRIRVVGWALSRSGIAKVEALAGDPPHIIGQAQFGVRRQDVRHLAEHFPNGVMCGFILELDSSALECEDESLRLRAVSLSGRTAEVAEALVKKSRAMAS